MRPERKSAKRAPPKPRTLDELARAYGQVQLATLVTKTPTGAWSYELKWDGYRILAMKSGSKARLVSRNHRDWTREFPSLVRKIEELDCRECVLDGEVCALDAKGRPSFQLLQNRGRGAARLTYFVFDLLDLDREDLRALPIEERRARLEELLATAKRDPLLAVSTAVESPDGKVVLDFACRAGLEGVLAKKVGSAYTPGRTKTWLKIKCENRQEFAIVGWLPFKNGPSLVGALILALVGDDGRLHFAGKVGTGFDMRTRRELAALFERDRSREPTALDVPRFGGLVRFVAPRHVAEVKFTEWTEGGNVRHPSFQGLRKDKSPRDCRRERPDGRTELAGVAISHPERVLDPAGVTKAELARYYAAVADKMLPHVAGRPLALLRWAEGKKTEKGGVFLRHARAWGPEALRRVRIREKKKTGEYLVVDDAAGLVALAQMDVLEIHTWSSRTDDLEHPDRLVFDLDPGAGVSWRALVRGARTVRRELQELGLESWVKTTGGKGLHVIVPLVPDAGWDTCFAFARLFAERVAAGDPKRFVAVMGESRRRGRIFVDYLRNFRTATAVAAYSIRAREGAPVSLPIDWSELDTDEPLRFHMQDALERPDPWGGYFRAKQKIPEGK